jgi:hypothetical protein
LLNELRSKQNLCVLKAKTFAWNVSWWLRNLLVCN